MTPSDYLNAWLGVGCTVGLIFLVLLTIALIAIAGRCSRMERRNGNDN